MKAVAEIMKALAAVVILSALALGFVLGFDWFAARRASVVLTPEARTAAALERIADELAKSNSRRCP